MSEISENILFEILGSVRVRAGVSQVAMPERERALLATLLLSVNELVDRSRLVDAIWGERSPHDARTQLHGCVSRLRKRLAAAGVASQPIVTHAAGYEIQVPLEQVDLGRFRRELGRARTAAEQGDYAAAVASYRAALSIWRGPALAGLDSHLLRQAAATLDEERVRVAEERIDLELSQGAAGELVPELTELVSHHPYRERLHAALMLALCQDGRQADALAAYQRVRRLLVDEVGTEPGPMLRELHQRILKEEQPGPSQTGALGNASALTARRYLPRSVGDFTGRADSVAQLIEMSAEAPTSPKVISIDGMAGIGKTTLAVHVAHLLADRYPDAQLFTDLHGHSEHRPVEPLAALESLLRQLGVAGGRIPADQDERASVWRGELAGRRMLVLLDNAASSEQVTPLLPGESGCLTIVTSRRKLTGLDSAHPLSLDQLPADEAIALLARVAGDRVREQPESAAHVVQVCGYLPLAIRLAGTRLAHRPNWQVADLAQRLLGAHEQLAELIAESRTVADAFALSYSQLTPTLQRSFRLLGLHPGEEFDVCAAAALIDRDLDATRRTLDDLVDHHLLGEPIPGRYRFHDLVREYARRLTTTADAETEGRAALLRVLDFYFYTTMETNRSLEGLSGKSGVVLGEAERSDLVRVAARKRDGWLEIERINLVSAVRVAGTVGAHQVSWRLARAAWSFFYYRGYIDNLLETHRYGMAAAEKLESGEAVATMCNYMASALFRRADFGAAEDLIKRALSIRVMAGDYTGAATSRSNLALVYRRQGRLKEAAEYFQQALATQQLQRDFYGIANTLQNLGLVYLDLGRYDEAIRCHRRRLAISRNNGDVPGIANPLGSLGTIRARLGESAMAERLLRASYWLNRKVGNRDSELVVGNDLGVLYRGLGRRSEAVAMHCAALTIAQEMGDVAHVCTVRNDLGRTLHEVGDIAAAIREHRIVLTAATRVGLKLERARALDGIAMCVRSTEPEVARQHWRQALALYREMGVPEQWEVDRYLSELPA